MAKHKAATAIAKTTPIDDKLQNFLALFGAICLVAITSLVATRFMMPMAADSLERGFEKHMLEMGWTPPAPHDHTKGQ